MDQTAARNIALARVEASSVLWRSLARIALREAAVRLPELTSDDVWRILALHAIPSPTEPRAMGPVMLRGVAEGWLDRTRQTRIADHPATPNHRRPQAVYRSRIVGAEPFSWPATKPVQEALW